MLVMDREENKKHCVSGVTNLCKYRGPCIAKRDREREDMRRGRVGGWLAVGSEREKEISEIIVNCSF